MLLLEDTVDLVLFTLSTICFIKANLGKTLSSNTRIFLSSDLPVTWCRSARLVHSWAWNQSYLIDIEMSRWYTTVIRWLTCRPEQTINCVILLFPDPFPQCFIYWNSWINENLRTMNPKTLSTVQMFQSFSHKGKSPFLQSCPKEFNRFYCKCIVNLLKGNLQSKKDNK